MDTIYHRFNERITRSNFFANFLYKVLGISSAWNRTSHFANLILFNIISYNNDWINLKATRQSLLSEQQDVVPYYGLINWVLLQRSTSSDVSDHEVAKDALHT